MGRAIVREPAAFLFDEPLSNLDAKLRVTMRAEIRRLQKRLGTTSLYVTHDQLEAMTLADRLVVLNGGRIEQVGTPIEVYGRPATLFVAGFIGSPAMNLVPGPAMLRTVPGLDRALGAVAGEDLVLGLRPEEVRLGWGGEGTLPATLRLTAIEAVGAETYLYGRLPDEGPEIALRAAGHLRHEIGDTVEVSFVPGALHRFSAATGQRLD